MTMKEALLYLATTDRNTEIGDEAKKILWKLVERDTPLKVITLYSGWSGNEFLEPPIYGCPVCKEEIHISFALCPYCGQRLDWSE